MRFRWHLIHAGVLLIMMMTAPWSWAGGATSVVKTILDQAMDIQSRPDLQAQEHLRERAQAILKLIADHFLAEEMARASLEGHWQGLTPEQRAEFEELFTVLFQDSYTRMVLNFLKRETIEYTGEETKGQDVWVQTVIMRANEHIPVDYDAVLRNGQWFIQDVKIDGVSIVGTYRNAFRRVILNQSFDGLLNKMRLQRRAIEGETSP